MSSSFVERAKALRAQMLASVAPQPAAERKTLKGQRKAAKAASKVTKRAKSLKVTAAAAVDLAMGWQLPVSFSQWLKWHRSGVDVVDADRGLVSDWARVGWDYALSLDSTVLVAQASLRNEYRRYVNSVFSSPIRWSGTDGNAFDKIVRREEALERQGKHDLGLLGYSAIDRAQLAVWYAWVHRVQRWLEQTGADKAYVQEMGQALRDLRSDSELRAVAELEGRSRYIVSGDLVDSFPRVRKQSQAAEVTKAARWMELRAEYATLPLVVGFSTSPRAEYTEGQPAVAFEYSSWIPTVGEVYRELFAVTKEGLRAFRNTLEGLTQDGIISDAAQYIASNRHDLAEAGLDRAVARLDKSLERLSAEDELFTRWDFDETFLKRQVASKTALQLPSHTVAEANAKAALQMLVDGASLIELREAYSDLSERAFSQLFRDAQVIMTEVQASDMFLVNWHIAAEEAATAALTA